MTEFSGQRSGSLWPFIWVNVIFWVQLEEILLHLAQICSKDWTDWGSVGPGQSYSDLDKHYSRNHVNYKKKSYTKSNKKSNKRYFYPKVGRSSVNVKWTVWQRHSLQPRGSNSSFALYSFCTCLRIFSFGMTEMTSCGQRKFRKWALCMISCHNLSTLCSTGTISFLLPACSLYKLNHQCDTIVLKCTQANTPRTDAVLKMLTLPVIYLHKRSLLSCRRLNLKPSSDQMCPTVSFLCVRPLWPSREPTSYFWTQFTPTCLTYILPPLILLPTSVEVFSLSRPRWQWSYSPHPGACFTVTEFSTWANYIIRMFDLVHFSSSHFIISDLAV